MKVLLINKRKGLIMPTQATVYKILIASPSDVEEERKVVPEVINSWNAVNSDHYGVRLEPVLWETHATPEMGKRPQAIINKQLVETCDILVAIFWTRLGTHTGEAESGTVEEIREFQKAEKPVLLYFSSIDVPQENIGLDHLEQYKKLLEFKKQCEKEGIVTSYKSIDELRMKLNMHITQKINSIYKIKVPTDSEKTKEMPTSILHSVGKTPVKAKIRFIEKTSAPIGIITTAVNPRIYDEKKMPSIGSVHLPSYKWDAQNFDGFWYDLQTGITSETLEIGGQHGNALTETIDHNRRVIPENTLVYRTVKQAKTLKIIENGKANATDAGFNKFDNGRYNLIGWEGQPYVAVKGKANKLANLIIEQGSAKTDTKILAVGETWDIGDGWTISAQSIDAKASPRQVWLVLSKDGIKLDDKVVAQGQVYVYIEKRFAGESDVPLFITYVDSIFAGATSDIVQLRYTWAMSTAVTEIKTSDVFGSLEVITADDDMLVLYNRELPIILPKGCTVGKGCTVDIMGNLKFRVADDPDFLRFYPVFIYMIISSD